MTDEMSEPEAPKRGKGDAIVTYGTVSALFNKLTRLDTKFDAFLAIQEERKEVQDAHGLTLRSLETRLTILETRSATSRSMIGEAWAVMFSVLSLIISAIGGASLIIWHPK